MDSKIGTWGDEQTPHQWPETTISGRAYTRPASTRDIGGGRFVVLDWPVAPDTDALIESLSKPARKRKSDSDDE